MCVICGSLRCRTGCPNAPAPVAIYSCEECGEGILPGDEYAVIDGVHYHLDCLEEMDIHTLLGLFGTYTETAREDDIYDGYDG